MSPNYLIIISFPYTPIITYDAGLVKSPRLPRLPKLTDTPLKGGSERPILAIPRFPPMLCILPILGRLCILPSLPRLPSLASLTGLPIAHKLPRLPRISTKCDRLTGISGPGLWYCMCGPSPFAHH